MRIGVILSAVILLLAGCQQKNGLPTDADVDMSRGAALYARDCTDCHGPDARGKVGPDLTKLATRAGGTFPRDHVMATVHGPQRQDSKDRVMPEFGERGMGQTVIVEHEGLGTPVPADLLALTTYLEMIQR